MTEAGLGPKALSPASSADWANKDLHEDWHDSADQMKHPPSSLIHGGGTSRVNPAADGSGATFDAVATESRDTFTTTVDDDSSAYVNEVNAKGGSTSTTPMHIDSSAPIDEAPAAGDYTSTTPSPNYSCRDHGEKWNGHDDDPDFSPPKNVVSRNGQFVNAQIWSYEYPNYPQKYSTTPSSPPSGPSLSTSLPFIPESEVNSNEEEPKRKMKTTASKKQSCGKKSSEKKASYKVVSEKDISKKENIRKAKTPTKTGRLRTYDGERESSSPVCSRPPVPSLGAGKTTPDQSLPSSPPSGLSVIPNQPSPGRLFVSPLQGEAKSHFIAVETRGKKRGIEEASEEMEDKSQQETRRKERALEHDTQMRQDSVSIRKVLLKNQKKGIMYHYN